MRGLSTFALKITILGYLVSGLGKSDLYNNKLSLIAC